VALRAGIQKDPGRTGIVMAHWESQSYWNESYTDLYDFCDRLERYCASDSGITGPCGEIKGVLEDKPHHFDNLVVFSDYYGPHYQFSHGLSIYLPWARPNERTMKTYGEYAFTKLANRKEEAWASFLEDYFDETLRLTHVNGYPTICTRKNLTQFARDRSGNLAEFEPPDLTHVFRKILNL